MKIRPLLIAVVATVAAGGGRVAADGPVADATCPQCPPEQIVWQEVISHRCKLVPETKQIKKTVYEVQEVPFCLKKLPPILSLLHHHGCDDCAECAECQCPRYKKVLVKKEVVCKEICTSKCVIEEFVERVPCQVCAPCQAQ